MSVPVKHLLFHCMKTPYEKDTSLKMNNQQQTSTDCYSNTVMPEQKHMTDNTDSE